MVENDGAVSKFRKCMVIVYTTTDDLYSRCSCEEFMECESSRNDVMQCYVSIVDLGLCHVIL
jgi:hypothetical protein